MLLAALPLLAQSGNGGAPAAELTLTSSLHPGLREELVREIDDPATGDRWLLERDAQHPGGPGRMVLIGRGKASPVPAGTSLGSVRSVFETGAPAALIHAGEPLIVEEHTSLLDAVLEAIALTPAAEGGTLRVRLSIGGRVVRAVAVARGRALLSPDPGARP
ncbi:MAG: hypothetical protein ACLQHF_04625 [Terracidiphilus sp.]